MNNLLSFINRMNIVVWIVGIFIAHMLLYMLLGTATWLATSLLATAVYAAVLLVLKLVAKRYEDNNKEKAR